MYPINRTNIAWLNDQLGKSKDIKGKIQSHRSRDRQSNAQKEKETMKKKKQTYKQWSKTKITSEKTIDWAKRTLGCWTVSYIYYVDWCFLTPSFSTIYKYRIDSGRSLHLHRFIRKLCVEFCKVLGNRFSKSILLKKNKYLSHLRRWIQCINIQS